MKGKLKVFLSAVMAILLFAGCSNIADLNKSVEGADADEKCVLTIGAKGYEDLSTQSGARTINPTAYTTSETFSKITIQGTSSNGVALPESALTFTSGEAKITLGYDIWYLTLTAYKSLKVGSETTESDHPVLMGRSVVNLKKGVSEIKFVLSTEGVDTPGTLTLGGDFSDVDDSVVHFTAGLYDIFTDALITGTEKAEVAVTKQDGYEASTDDTKNKKNFAYTKTEVAPGRYMFKIKFFMNTAATGTPVYKQIGFWSDEVVIAPGRNTPGDGASVHLPNIINTLPVSPSEFTVSYENDSDAAGSYTAVLKWKDNSTNEENFVIKLMEYDAWAATATPTKTIYLGVDQDPDTDPAPDEFAFYSSSWRKDGTLATSQTSCKLTLPAGKLFNFEIAAQNSIGKSAFVARDTTDPAAPTGCTLYPAANKVTRTRIVYDVVGGTITFSDDSTKNNSYEKYYTYAGSDITLLTVGTGTGKDCKSIISAGHNPFTKWVAPNDATGAEKLVHTSWQNAIYKASYDQTYIVTYTIDDSYGSITAAAVYANDATAVASSTTSCKNAVIDLSAAGAVNPVIKFSVTPAGSESYDYIEVRMSNGINEFRYTAYADEYILNTSAAPLSSGTYSVVVLAHNSADAGDMTKLNSDVFAITIKR